MKYPEFLQKNGTIGYVAPSFGCAIEPYKSAFANALAKFEAMGYKADIGPNVYEESGIGISSTPGSCGEELNDSYCGEQNNVIISCGGGELVARGRCLPGCDHPRQSVCELRNPGPCAGERREGGNGCGAAQRYAAGAHHRGGQRV